MMVSLWRLALLSLFLAAAAGAGRTFLWATGFDRTLALRGAVHSLLALTLGLGVLSYATLAIGLIGWLYAPVIWGLLLAFVVTGVWFAGSLSFRSLPATLRHAWTTVGELNWPYKVLLAWLVLTASLNLVGALAPPLSPDDLHYHFAVPRRYVMAHNIHFIPDKYYSNLPYTMEMLWTAAIAIDAGELAQLVNWSIGLLILGWIAVLCRTLGLGVQGASVAVVIFYGVSTVNAQSRTGVSELGGALFLVACVYVLLQWRSRPRFRLLAIAGILAGLFAGTKLFNPLTVALVSLWIAWMHWRQDGSLMRGLGTATTFAGVAAAVVGVWYLKTWLYTGNPIYPFMRSIFGGPEIRAVNYAGVAVEAYGHSASAMFRPVRVMRQLPDAWTQLLSSGDANGWVGPVYLALLPAALLDKRIGPRARPGYWGLIGVLALAWSIIHYYVRAALPALALLSVGIGGTAVVLGRKSQILRIVIAITIGLWCLVTVGNNLRTVTPAAVVVTGLQNPSDYIMSQGSKRWHYSAQDAYDYINQQLPPTARILLWETRGYYLKREYIHASEFVQTMTPPGTLWDMPRLLRELRLHGITHVAMNDNTLPARAQLREALESAGVLKCLFEGASMLVCRINYPEIVEQ